MSEGSALFHRAMRHADGDTDPRGALMRQVWEPTPWMVDTFTDAGGSDRMFQVVEWCEAMLGDEAEPLRGRVRRSAMAARRRGAGASALVRAELRLARRSERHDDLSALPGARERATIMRSLSLCSGIAAASVAWHGFIEQPTPRNSVTMTDHPEDS